MSTWFFGRRPLPCNVRLSGSIWSRMTGILIAVIKRSPTHAHRPVEGTQPGAQMCAPVRARDTHVPKRSYRRSVRTGAVGRRPECSQLSRNGSLYLLDGQEQATTTDTAPHPYSTPGNYLVLATATLSNGKVTDTSQGLFPVQVGAAPAPANPNPLGITTSLGALAFNKTLSSSGAPFIPTGGHIVFVGAVGQPSKFKYVTLVDPLANRYTNYSWNVSKLKLDFGDGSTPVTVGTDAVPHPASDEPNVSSDHSYANGGIFLATLQVTTGNFSNTQTNRTPVWQPVATGETQTTTVGMTVPVGSYHPLTYSGNVIKPGIITNMEAVTGGYTSPHPALDYESTGFEVIANVYEELIQYNGTSTSEFVPVIADQIPSVANGQITPDFLNYTFHIRQGLKFSNGDPVTPLDVKYSISRTLLMNSG